MATPGGVAFGIGVGIVDVLIWRHFVPNVSDIRTAPSYNMDIEKAERLALYTGTAFTLVVAGFARSAEVFAIGGLTLVALDFATKHANAVNPTSGKIETQTSAQSTTYPMPDYAS
jgi:hypothetical protein